MKIKFLTLFLIACITLACNSNKKQNDVTDNTDSLVSTPATETPPTETSVKKFEINAIPVSDKPLGAFPYFNLPENYEGTPKNNTADYDVAYFWVKDHFEKPEGKIFYARITAKEGKSYSDLEVAKNLEELIKSIDGVKISEMKVHSDSSYTIPENNRIKYMNGYGFMGNAITTTYLIRRPDRNIWVQLTPGDDAVSAGWMILETKPFKMTASLTKADEMKKELDSKGHIALYINFDTNKATIKTESSPIIDEIQKLLTANSSLKITIEGHTDNTGLAAQNKKLSEERASAVKTALISKGINASRLQTKGWGSDKPIADNTSEENKAKNRRVEIVKL
ncbi:OmpA family protein [Flavobacterium collinsii]|uniref:Peptidoglycan-associated lipoprotein n=1 Tax=Flavobacterium collinsii TaxID=1114861 RepID=A0A9W4X365_9FLAO|nr:OmpA family protein [Flavobacterium collinsii]CAA9195579.1 Peptidoglycan-associated lipoprotein [Flavobacterium collinsii]CAI2766993.1 Peptidoglycan-associated lipoprotein [Flavobacterium collinsii]